MTTQEKLYDFQERCEKILAMGGYTLDNPGEIIEF